MNRLPSSHLMASEGYSLQFSIESHRHLDNGSCKYVLRIFKEWEEVEYYMFPSVRAAMDFLNLNFDLSNE